MARHELGERELAALEEIPGLRVNHDRRERMLYVHDVGELPGIARRALGRVQPAAIVQPETEQQVVAVVQWARRFDVPLVPRGSATSGYGGVLPVEGGVVVELTRLDRVLEVNAAQMEVTVEPGIVWRRLAEELEKYGLAPRLVPSSAPGSTVGGWLSQAGGGIGSYQYGWFGENVVSARVVLPDGTVKDFAGPELDLIYGSMGTTGIVTQVTIKVRELASEEIAGAVFGNPVQVQQFLTALAGAGLPLWHVGFMNPVGTRLKNQVPPRTHHGHVEDRPVLPEGYLALVAYPAGAGQGVRGAIEALIAKNGGQVLAEEITAHEWEDRFNPMKVKRIGPSLIPAEVVVPVSSLAAALEELNGKVKLPLVLEATVVKGEDVILLGFIPHDIRRLSFNFAYALSLSVLKVAHRHGGRAYASGLYLPGEAASVYGPRLEKIRQFTRAHDPGRMMNPGKLAGKAMFRSLLSVSSALEPLVRFLGNSFRPDLQERWPGKGRLPGDVVWYAYSCAQCGYCRSRCTLYDARSWESASPRGKWYFLRLVAEGKAAFDQEITNTFLMCTTCEKCDFSCQLGLPVEPAWGTMRGELVNTGKFMSFPAFEMMAASLRKEKNIWANFSRDRDAWVPEEVRAKIKDRADIAYFAGCTASFVERDIGQGSMLLLDRAGVEFTYLGQEEACCGIPMLVAGRWDVFEEILRHNIAAMKKRGVKTVVTSCPACWLSWHTYYPEWAQKLGIAFPFETKHYSEVIAEKIARGEVRLEQPVNLKVAFHDSCHIGRAGGVYEPPRQLLRAIPGLELVEMEHNREDSLCCGSVLTRISEPEPTSNLLGQKRIEEAVAAGAEALAALCPCCQFQLRVSADNRDIKMPVVDLAAVTARAMGIELPDPTPYALEMWAVFDKMIQAMQVPAMAEMMTGLIPKMMAAMPSFLRGMMGMVKYVPGMAALMKPVMPRMMPMLMPGIMPKVMPDMLREMERRIPMPDFMKQQMPDLMPAVMQSMMPHILPDVARIVTPAMLSYIKTGKLQEKAA